MSFAALARDTDSIQSSKAKTASSGLRINQPGDSFELEADRVAETVSNGGHIAGWSLSTCVAGGIQRQSVPAGTQPPPPVPQSTCPGDILQKLAEAFMATKAGKDLLELIKSDKVVKGATDFATTPGGIVIAGSAAVGTVSALAVAHKPLPLQIPKIPLDFVTPGLGVKINYEGPVNHPTAASLTVSYEGKAPKKKSKESDTDRYRAETAQIAADQEKFKAGMQPQSAPGPGPRVGALQTDEQQMIEEWNMRRFRSLGGGGDFKSPTPASSPPTTTGLRPPTFEPPYKPKTPTLLDKKLELKPITLDTPKAAGDEKKKEELPLQRKADSAGRIFGNTTDVESVIHSSGRPLDPETRRYMESRIGFNFSNVRLHTDERAASSARSVGARAYTVGNNIVFASGHYAPQTARGRRLLAHELTHVVQQNSSAQRVHPVIRPAPRQVQRLWGINLPDAKAWLLGKLRNLKGYPLFCVVIGKDLITGEVVPQNPTTLTQGVLGLFEGGPALFEKLKKAADALQTAYDWLVGEIKKRDLTEEYFSGLLDKALASVELLHPEASWDRIKALLQEPLDKLIDLASVVGKKVLDFILEALLAVFGDTGRKVYAFFKKTGNVISRIAADPLSFAKNLFKAVQEGFTNFGTNILAHLGEGVKTWIFEELAIKGVTIPTEFTFGSILNLILQVLGLTYAQQRPQLVALLSEPEVYFIETAAETTTKVITRIRKEGFSAIWEMLKEQASKIFDSLLDSIKSWIVEQIVTRGLLMVAKLANPVGELVQAIESIYETVNFIIDKASKLADLIDTVVNALSDIVEANTGPAAKKVEDSLSRTIPLLLRFLAGQLHLTGLGKSIREIIEKIRAPIDKAIGAVLKIIVDKAKPLWEAGKAAFTSRLESLKEWWSKPKKFQYGEEDHKITIEGDGNHPDVMVHSAKTPLEHFLKDVHATPKQTKDILKLAGQLKWRQGEAQKPADDEKGAKDFDKLREMMDGLKAKEPAKARIKYPQAPHSLGGGVEADAYLSSNHEVGTEPSGTDPVIWNDLGYLRDQKEKYYVRGHLLSMRLGGEGIWKNMMPITNTVNQRMNAQVEDKLKKAIGSGKRSYHYNIKAKYADTVLPPAQDGDPAAQKQRAIDAESRLLSLSWTVKPATFDKDGGGWKEADGALLDADGKTMDARVAQGDFTPPTTRK